MKNKIIVALVFGLMLSVSTARAEHDGKGPHVICPMKTLENADELKLSDKQKEQVEKVKEEALAAMEKINGEMKSILSKGQIKKYEKLAAEGSGKCEKKEKCEDKEKCDGKDAKTCPAHKKDKAE